MSETPAAASLVRKVQGLTFPIIGVVCAITATTSIGLGLNLLFACLLWRLLHKRGLIHLRFLIWTSIIRVNPRFSANGVYQVRRSG